MFSFLALYLTIQILSLIFLPFSLKLFSHLPDKGYAFSKSLSFLVNAFIAWYLISLKLLRFTRPTLILLSLAIFAVSFLLSRPFPLSFRPQRKRFLYVVFVEVLFLTLFLFTSYLKFRTSPIMGTEKPMDFALINGIFRSDYFPPQDAWYAGKTINYYYFGQYLIAFIAKLSALPTRVIFTLALPLVFSLTALNIFGLVYNAIKKKSLALVLALLAVAFILFGANFDTPIQLIKAFVNHTPPDLGWWEPSRVIGRGFNPKSYITITEFPYFSLLLGDVHAHVIALPLGSLYLGLLFSLVLSFRLPLLVLSSGVLASLAMTNPWELPFYFILSLAVLLFLNHRHQSHLLSATAIILLSFLIFTLPFVTHFQMILPVNDPKPLIFPILDQTLIGRRTLLSEFLTIWGTHLVVIVFSLLLLSLKKIRLHREIFFPLLTGLTGFFILLFCEFFFINDFFTAPAERMNTVFKLYYQAWLILGLAAFILFGYIWEKLSAKIRLLIVSVLGLFLAANFTYFFTATPLRLKEFSQTSWSLDGLKYLAVGGSGDQSDLAAVNWFNANVKDQVNIVESVIDPSAGISYSQIGRISVATGLPTILGWYAVNHEAGWRNNDPDIYRRASDVNQIYLSPDLNLVKQLLDRYQVRYIYLGALEKAAYPAADFSRFAKLGKLVFQKGLSQIYQVE